MTLLERLKSETQQHHTELESTLGLPSSADHYRDQIAAFYGFVCPWETEILGSSHASLLIGRVKTPWLAADLNAAGIDHHDQTRVPLSEALPPLDTREEVLGSMYVLEGSTLGGQMISRYLERTLGLSGGRGYAYHQSYGTDVPRKWREFKEVLLSHSSPRADEAIIASADQTFANLHRWFKRRLAPALA